MLRKLMVLAAVTGFVAATALLPVGASAGGHEWNRQVQGQHDGHHGQYQGPHFTVITQPTHQVQIRPYYPHRGHYHPGYGYVAQPVWVPAGWYWTGYDWVWVTGYWR